jgi:hypothetical protein
MIDINTKIMKEYESEKKDSYVNCTDNIEIIEFLARYIKWLEDKLVTK